LTFDHLLSPPEPGILSGDRHASALEPGISPSELQPSPSKLGDVCGDCPLAKIKWRTGDKKTSMSAKEQLLNEIENAADAIVEENPGFAKAS
jgi:hypothetical protein